MLIGMIRPTATQTLEAAGEVQADVRADLEARAPEGYVLTDAPVTMQKRSTAITMNGTYRATRVEEIEADDMDTLLAKVPDGWQLLNVRRL